MTIRKYPHHGKFEGQPLIAEYVYELSLDGPDEELSFDGDPWLGLIKLYERQDAKDFAGKIVKLAASRDDTLTNDERKLLQDLSGIIVEETGQGFVNVGFYSKSQIKALGNEWWKLEKEYERWSEKGGW